MKRGTIAYLGSKAEAVSVLPTYADDGCFVPLFLNLFLKRLKEWGFPNIPDYVGRAVRRWRGDLLELGKGEILAALPS